MLALVLSPLEAAPPKRDYAAPGASWSILPPGENGSLTFDRNTTDQAKLYDGLTQLRGAVTQRDLRRFFKPAPLGLGSDKPRKRERPRAGVTIVRDSFGVAHVTGKTEADVAFGAGWVTAADRGLLLQLIRGPARVAALDVPGVDPLALALSGRTFVPSAEAEAFLSNQLDALRAQGPTGRRLLAIVNAYAAGINAWYRAKGIPAAPFTAKDVVASAALIAARFGANGGQEVENAMFLHALEGRLGESQARRVFADLHDSNDAEAPVSVPGSFPYELPVAGPRPEAWSSTTEASPERLSSSRRSPPAPCSSRRSARRRGTRSSSRARRSGTSSRSSSPRWSSRAPASPRAAPSSPASRSSSSGAGPTSPGARPPRRRTTSTSSSRRCARTTDTTSTAASARPCGGSSRARSGRRAHPTSPWRTTRRRTGLWSATRRSRGSAWRSRPQRSTRGREILSSKPFYELNTGRVTSSRRFLQTMSAVEFSFNWFYADDRDIAFFSSGRLPLRAPGTDPSLPTVGTGEYDWRGFLPFAAHAQAVNPPSGLILNWNNKPAADVGSADSNFAYGSVHRVELCVRALAARRKHTLAGVTGVMNAAATQDLRTTDVWPAIRAVLRTGNAPSARAEAAVGLVDAWRGAGSSRLDRDLDGKVDDPGAAVLDAAWPRLADAVMSPGARAARRPARAADGAKRRPGRGWLGVHLGLVRLRRQGPEGAPRPAGQRRRTRGATAARGCS